MGFVEDRAKEMREEKAEEKAEEKQELQFAHEETIQVQTEEEATATREERDSNLVEHIVSSMARVIDRHKTILPYPSVDSGIKHNPVGLEVSTCPLCGAIVGDSTLHARIHVGSPDMQLALLNAL